MNSTQANRHILAHNCRQHRLCAVVMGMLIVLALTAFDVATISALAQGDGRRDDVAVASEDDKPSDGGVDDSAKKKQTPLELSVTQFRYFPEIKLLAIRIEFHNSSDRPIFLVSNESSFIRFGPMAPAEFLAVKDREEDSFTLDLSHPILNEGGLRYYLSSYASRKLGPSSKMIKLSGKEIRYLTYVFQFPIGLNGDLAGNSVDDFVLGFNISPGKKSVRVRFGYANEHFNECEKKTRKAELLDFKEITTEIRRKWQDLLQKEWQKTITTEPITFEVPEQEPGNE